MKRVRKRNMVILLCVTCLYCLNRFWLKRIPSLPAIEYILKCHFNDFLAGIAILAYVNLILSFSIYQKAVIVSFSKGVIFSFVCGVLWEYIMPVFFPHGTSDYLDIASYILGGVFYILIFHTTKQLRPLRSDNMPCEGKNKVLQ